MNQYHNQFIIILKNKTLEWSNPKQKTLLRYKEEDFFFMKSENIANNTMPLHL